MGGRERVCVYVYTVSSRILTWLGATGGVCQDSKSRLSQTEDQHGRHHTAFYFCWHACSRADSERPALVKAAPINMSLKG